MQVRRHLQEPIFVTGLSHETFGRDYAVSPLFWVQIMARQHRAACGGHSASPRFLISNSFLALSPCATWVITAALQPCELYGVTVTWVGLGRCPGHS